MSTIAIAMSGMRAATARFESAAETLVTQPLQPPAPGRDAAPPANPMATPMPKVYRPLKTGLHGLAPGHLPAQDPAGALVEQQQASAHYRASLGLLRTANAMQDEALDLKA